MPTTRPSVRVMTTAMPRSRESLYAISANPTTRKQAIRTADQDLADVPRGRLLSLMFMFYSAVRGLRTLNRSALAALLVCAASGSASLATLSGQALPQVQTPAATFQQNVLPVLEKNCFSCHSDRVHSGGLSLESFRDPMLVTQS